MGVEAKRRYYEVHARALGPLAASVRCPSSSTSRPTRRSGSCPALGLGRCTHVPWADYGIWLPEHVQNYQNELNRVLFRGPGPVSLLPVHPPPPLFDVSTLHRERV